jgi:hypothetical protein
MRMSNISKTCHGIGRKLFINKTTVLVHEHGDFDAMRTVAESEPR